MAHTVITKKELTIPIDVILEVVDVLLEQDIDNEIIGTDEENNGLIIEVQYEKEQRDIIHHIEDLIADQEESDEDDEDE